MATKKLEVGTTSICRLCQGVIEFGKAASDPFGYSPYWFSPERQEDNYASRKCPTKSDDENAVYLAPTHEPENWCMQQKGDYSFCGRLIPEVNIREGVMACGIHYKKVELEHRLAVEQAKKIAERNASLELYRWSEDEVNMMVAKFMVLTGCMAKPEETPRYRRGDGDLHSGIIMVNVFNLMEWIESLRAEISVS